MPNKEIGERDSEVMARLIGELIAEVRALKHGFANSSQKLEALNVIAANQTEMINRMNRMEKEQYHHGTRLSVLEADKLRREGAVSVGEWFARHWPFSIVMAALAAFIAWANGRLHP